MTQADHRPAGSVPGQFALDRKPSRPDLERGPRDERQSERVADGVMFFLSMLACTGSSLFVIAVGSLSDGWPGLRVWLIYGVVVFALSPLGVLLQRWARRTGEARKARRAASKTGRPDDVRTRPRPDRS